jgi:hypothetical protein
VAASAIKIPSVFGEKQRVDSHTLLLLLERLLQIVSDFPFDKLRVTVAAQFRIHT